MVRGNEMGGRFLPINTIIEEREQVEKPQLAVTQLAVTWAKIRRLLHSELGETEYRNWLRPMTFKGLNDDEIVVSLPSGFVRDWVRDHYGARLYSLWKSECPVVRRLEFVVDSDASLLNGVTPVHGESMKVRVDADEKPDPRGDIAGALDPRFTFEAFVVGKPNEVAYACARRVAEHPATHEFNPLFLYGGVGLGKTHLMHAIGWYLQDHRGAGGKPVSVAYLSAEKFMYRFIAAIRGHQTIEFKEQLRGVDVLMVDDLQFLVGKENTQEEFFHTFNYLVESGKQIVISADKSPADLNGLDHRLRTRLGCGMVADLHSTTFELRISILESKAARAGVPIGSKVLEFLAHKITTNVRELEGALNRLIAHANLFGRDITLETTQEVLHDILRVHDRKVTIEEIQKRVSEHYNIRQAEMTSARRARAVARPRQVAMYLAKQLTSRSLPEIGRKFGNRDHTTVMHAVTRVNELMQIDGDFADGVELLRRSLES
jgi:chromosomal replication initiator protein